MKPEEVKLGQIWIRKDGRKVRLDDERVFRGSREFLLVPLEAKGRKAWKWDGGVINDLTFDSN
jgi:hypothetical protein